MTYERVNVDFFRLGNTPGSGVSVHRGFPLLRRQLFVGDTLRVDPIGYIDDSFSLGRVIGSFLSFEIDQNNPPELKDSPARVLEYADDTDLFKGRLIEAGSVDARSLEVVAKMAEPLLIISEIDDFSITRAAIVSAIRMSDTKRLQIGAENVITGLGSRVRTLTEFAYRKDQFTNFGVSVLLVPEGESFHVEADRLWGRHRAEGRYFGRHRVTYEPDTEQGLVMVPEPLPDGGSEYIEPEDDSPGGEGSDRTAPKRPRPRIEGGAAEELPLKVITEAYPPRSA